VLSECCQSDSTLTAMAKIIGTLILSSKQKQITTKGTKKSRKTAHGVGFPIARDHRRLST